MKQLLWCLFLLSFTAAGIFTGSGMFLSRADAAELIAVDEAHKKVNTEQALLVCAYDSDEAFNKMRLQNAIALSEFKAKLSGVDMAEMIIFYCA
jgi:pyridoxal biosynthesis lyase PdxS